MTVTLKQFVTSDDLEIFEAYYAGPGDIRNTWDTAIFTREQAEKYLAAYDLRFTPTRLIWYSAENPRGEEVPSQLYTTATGEQIEGYEIPGEFMLAEELVCQYGNGECLKRARWIMEHNTTHKQSPMCNRHAWKAHETDHTHNSVTDSEIKQPRRTK